MLRKFILINVILVFGSVIYSRTDSLEKATLFDKLKAKEIRQDVFAETLSKWKQTILEIGSYPDIPLDHNKQAHYDFSYNF